MPSSTAHALTVLRRFAQSGPSLDAGPQHGAAQASERCELCSLPLGPEHAHLVEPATRRLLCACDACAILFSQRAETRYRRVPRDSRWVRDFRLTDAEWTALAIPINLAFILHSAPSGKATAIYPSPGGPTESPLEADDWDAVLRSNPILRQMEPDTEALLINRIGPAREYFLAPIDRCYQLVGLVRAHWQGFSGGTQVWQEIDAFFDRLRQTSREYSTDEAS